MSLSMHSKDTYILLKLYMNLQKTWVFASSLNFKLLYYCPQFFISSLLCWSSFIIFSLFFLKAFSPRFLLFLVWLVAVGMGVVVIQKSWLSEMKSLFVCSDVFMLQAHSTFVNILEKKLVKFYFQEQKTLRNSVYKPKRIVYTVCSRNITYLWF